MLIIEAIVSKPNSRGGPNQITVTRKAFQDHTAKEVQEFLDKDFFYPYDKDECSLKFNYIKL